jgi:hypothetical protein
VKGDAWVGLVFLVMGLIIIWFRNGFIQSIIEYNEYVAKYVFTMVWSILSYAMFGLFWAIFGFFLLFRPVMIERFVGLICLLSGVVIILYCKILGSWSYNFIVNLNRTEKFKKYLGFIVPAAGMAFVIFGALALSGVIRL